MTFQQQKDEILKFYETTNEVVEQHKQNYGKLVSKLNEKKGLTQSLTNNIDAFMERSFPDFALYRKTIESQPLDDSGITHTFDINKNEYITGFTLPNKCIVARQQFKCELMDTNSNFATLANGKPWGWLNESKSKKIVHSLTTRACLTNSKTILETDKPIVKPCNCDSACVCSAQHYQQQFKSLTCNSYVYHKKEAIDIEFWIDDYFNIYIPKLKTYLVYNYSKFPLYSFFINIDKLNLYHNNVDESNIRTIMFNENYPDDLEIFNLAKSFVSCSTDYLTSKDKRNHYKTLFPDLLKFYQYYDKHLYFAQYQNLADKFEQLSPMSSDLTFNDNDNENTMTAERNIFLQSQRIRELEIVNKKQFEEIECLRNERTQYIKKDHISSVELSDYKKLLEELNSQLHEEIDRNSIQQKEIIRLKNTNIEYCNYKTQYRLLEDVNESITQRQSELEDNLCKIKTLNSTLVDKQTEIHQKMLLERDNNKIYLETIKNLKLEITTCNDRIKDLQNLIYTEKSEHRITKKRVDEMVLGMNKNTESVDGKYQEILLSQLKEKTDEITHIQLLNTNLTKDIEASTKNFNLLKSQVSALLNK